MLFVMNFERQDAPLTTDLLSFTPSLLSGTYDWLFLKKVDGFSSMIVRPEFILLLCRVSRFLNNSRGSLSFIFSSDSLLLGVMSFDGATGFYS